ncbi:MAG: YgiT-type zinc finger protein [Thermoflexales bacterium]|nr:YgiT-type zinc finger protein [Thermoflexales bacterium]
MEEAKALVTDDDLAYVVATRLGVKAWIKMLEYDDCTFCGGRVQARLVTKACWWGDQLVAIVEDVPAGVCDQCGERYYKVHVLKEIEALLSRKESFRTTQVPLGSFALA